MKLRNEAAFIAPKQKEPCVLIELEITVSPQIKFTTFATGASAELALTSWKRRARRLAPRLTRTTVITPDPTGATEKMVTNSRSEARLPRYLRKSR